MLRVSKNTGAANAGSIHFSADMLRHAERISLERQVNARCRIHQYGCLLQISVRKEAIGQGRDLTNQSEPLNNS